MQTPTFTTRNIQTCASSLVAPSSVKQDPAKTEAPEFSTRDIGTCASSMVAPSNTKDSFTRSEQEPSFTTKNIQNCASSMNSVSNASAVFGKDVQHKDVQAEEEVFKKAHSSKFKRLMSQFSGFFGRR